MVEWQGKGLQNPQHGFPAARDYANPIDGSHDCGLRIDDCRWTITYLQLIMVKGMRSSGKSQFHLYFPSLLRRFPESHK
jgi:hypothetical protein